MSHILVTGGCGFIGSHLVDRLLADGQAVTSLDNFDPFYDPAIKWRRAHRHQESPRFRLIEGDIRDTDALDGVEAPVDAIVHLAAKAGVRPSIDDPIGYQQVNVQGTQCVLEYARRNEIPRIIFGSSSSVYGINPDVPWAEDACVLRPISPYAATKVACELLGHTYHALYGMQFIALRFFTVYGPRQRPDLAIHKFAQRMADGAPIAMYGDGSTRRDYTYIADIVEGILAAIAHPEIGYEVINLGNSVTVSLREMIRTLERTLGMRARVNEVPAQPGDVPQTWASIEKAREVLNWHPHVAFDEGMEMFGHWFREGRP